MAHIGPICGFWSERKQLQQRYRGDKRRSWQVRFAWRRPTLTSEVAGRRSLFLIDDIGAELDAAHNARFFRALEAMDSQVFATATSDMALGLAFAGHKRQLFHVEQGACHPIGTEGL